MKENQSNPGVELNSNAPLPYLDGVRGLAILLVGLGHIFYDYYIFKIGWVGLNLFFVLSGYLITQRLYHFSGQSIRNYFRNFYARRILRIFPLYYLVLAFFLVILPGLSVRFYNHFSSLGDIQMTYWTYTSNWNMIVNGLPGQSIFFHFWSLAVEEQFYFLWPILFVLFTGTRARYILIAIIISISIFARIITVEPLHAYVSTLTAAEPLLIGSLISIVAQNGFLKKMAKWMTVAAVISIIGLSIIFILNSDLHITNLPLMKYGYSAINLVMGFLLCSVLTGQLPGMKLRTVFSMNWLRWLGKYSYAIYVFHWIVLQTLIFRLDYFLRGTTGSELTAYFVARGLGILFILLISYCSYHFLEKYFIGMKKYFSQDKAWKWPDWQMLHSLKRERKLARD